MFDEKLLGLGHGVECYVKVETSTEVENYNAHRLPQDKDLC